MNIIRLIILVVFLFNGCFAFAATVTALSLIEKDSVTTSNYPLTFGHVFKDGDVSDYVQVRYNGTLLATQCDVKTTYGSGDVRFAVISVVLPSVSSGSTNTIVLETAASTSSSGYLDKTDILDTDIEDEIRLTNLSGSGYSGSLTADLNAQITADSSPTYWLQGSVCTEVLVRDGLNDSLEASWEVRFYSGTSFGPRISHSIENMNADYRGIVNYDVDIQAGLPTLSSKYTKSSVQHNENSRWRKVIWIGSEPPETELHYDLSYLISTGAVMNYDTSITVPESALSSAYSTWLTKDRDIMGNGSLLKYFPSTGGREEIGVLPAWSARYLLSMDNRMREIVIGNGEMSAHCPIHYRESNSGESFYRQPVSIDDRPTIWTDEWRISTSWGNAADRLPLAIGNTGTAYHGWTIDRAHQGSFAFLPYLITGERYFLDEMYYWAAWDLSASTYNSDYGRDYSEGLIRDQVRGEAWSLRNMVDAALFAADSDSAFSAYLTDKIGNNITEWITEEDRYPLNYWGYADGYTPQNPPMDTTIVQWPATPWQDDFVLLSLTHAKNLGFDTSAIISWFSAFIINRFTNPDFNPFNGAQYHFPGQLVDDSYPATWAEADTCFNVDPTAFPVDGSESPDSYRFIAMAAASTITDISGGQDTYDFLLANVDDQEELATNPTWAIVPLDADGEPSTVSLGTVLLGQ